MDRFDLIELDDTHAVEIVLCGNAETVCDGTDLFGADSVTQKEATTAACDAANEEIWKALHGFCSADSCFSHWHGGKHGRADLSGRIAVANLFARTEPENEDDCHGDWEWSDKAGWSEPLLARVTAALDAADKAAESVLEEEALSL